MTYLRHLNLKKFSDEQPEKLVTPPITSIQPQKNGPGRSLRRVLRATRERFQVYRAAFYVWRLQRPFWGALLMLVASILILLGPVSLLRFALLPGSTIWAGLLIGSLLLVMSLIQLFVPALAVITGAVGIVLSMISIVVALGGFGLGLLLGIIGGALGVAWRANARTLRSISAQKARPRRFLRFHSSS